MAMIKGITVTLYEKRKTGKTPSVIRYTKREEWK